MQAIVKESDHFVAMTYCYRSCSKALPMTPAFTKPINTFWLRRLLLVCSIGFGAFVVYAVSFGPVLWLCGASPSTGWSGLPSGVRMVYAPLAHMPEPFAGALDHYEQWWIGVE